MKLCLDKFESYFIYQIIVVSMVELDLVCFSQYRLDTNRKLIGLSEQSFFYCKKISGDLLKNWKEFD